MSGRGKFFAAALAALAIVEVAAVYFSLVPEGGALAEKDRLVETVRMGILPSPSKRQAIRAWTPLLQRMNASLDFRLEPYYASDYAEIIHGFLSGRLDVAVMDPAMAFDCLSSRPETTILAVCDDSGAEADHAILATRNPAVLGVDQSRGMRLAFVSPLSLSGCLIPRAFLDRKLPGGLHGWFSSVRYADTEEQAAHSLMSGSADIIAISRDALAASVRANNYDDKGVNAIWISPEPLPPKALCANPHTIKRVDALALRQSLLVLQGPRPGGGEGTLFASVDKSTYLVTLREVCDAYRGDRLPQPMEGMR